MITPKISPEALTYKNKGYKVDDLWTVDTRIVSSFDNVNQYGGLEAGRLDIEWTYWKDKTISPHKWIISKKSGLGGLDEYVECDSIETVAAQLGAINPINYRTDGITLEFKVDEDGRLTKGITRLELVYLDKDGWIKLNERAIGATQTPLLTIMNGVDFDLLIKDRGSNVIYNYRVDATVPYPMSNVKFDLGKHTVTFQDPSKIIIQAVTQLTMEDVWIRYHQGDESVVYQGLLGGECSCDLGRYVTVDNPTFLTGVKVDVPTATAKMDLITRKVNRKASLYLSSADGNLKIALEDASGGGSTTRLTFPKDGRSDTLATLKDIPKQFFRMEDTASAHAFYKRELKRLSDKLEALENK